MAKKSPLTSTKKFDRQSKPVREKKPKPQLPPKGDIGTKTAHAKWPAMYKRHLGMIESHIKTLDRVMQSMKASMDIMGEKEKGQWERGERGNWGVMCGMMQRALQCMKDAKAGGEGILPDRFLKEKKGLAAMGYIAAAYTGPIVRPKGGEPTVEDFLDPNTDSSSSDSDNADGEEEQAEAGIAADGEVEKNENPIIITNARTTKSPSPAPAPTADFVPLTVGKKRKLSTGAEETSNGDANGTEEANPYFVVDTQPTPLPTASDSGKPIKKAKKKHTNGSIPDGELQKSKKRAREGEKGDSEPKKNKVGSGEVEEEVSPGAGVDFLEVERQLRDEVQAAMDAKAAKKAEKAEKKEKKRKRVSDGATSAEVVVKKSKKEKRRQDVEGEAGEGENGAGENAKKEKKKKRKLEEE